MSKYILASIVIFACTLLIIIGIVYLHRTVTEKVSVLSIDQLVQDKGDTTEQQREIHRRAAESEFWERSDLNLGLYA
jgi:hypothetical protein